jgi:hypothetical protein
MEAETRLIHWYDTEQHRIACGARGQSNSTKHRRGVTCAACRARIAAESRSAIVSESAGAWVQ